MPMNDEQAEVYIVDDDPMVRRSFKRLFKLAGYAATVFESAEDFLANCPREARGCLLLDVCLPSLNGLDLQQELADNEIFLPIVFITGHGDIPMTVRAMKAGAVDFLPKPIDEPVLLEAARRAILRDAQEREKRELKGDARRRIDSLSPREREVLELVIAGLLNKQIARRLEITERTVKAHRHNLMEKSEVDSVAELVELALIAGVQPKH
jgi:RNA polymerase sigma factor (sigma-70 family)